MQPSLVFLPWCSTGDPFAGKFPGNDLITQVRLWQSCGANCTLPMWRIDTDVLWDQLILGHLCQAKSWKNKQDNVRTQREGWWHLSFSLTEIRLFLAFLVIQTSYLVHNYQSWHSIWDFWWLRGNWIIQSFGSLRPHGSFLVKQGKQSCCSLLRKISHQWNVPSL